MAWKAPPALGLLALLTALTLALSACGGGTTADPVAVTTDAATATPPAAQTTPPVTQPPATTPSVAATAPPGARTATTATPPDPVKRPRPSGGTSTDSSAASANEPAPQEGTTTATTPASQPAESQLDERATLVLARRVSPSHYFQQGAVTGTYGGTMEVEARITSKGVLASFIATLPGGTISGHGVAVAVLDSTTWPSLRGRAIVTGGSGRFAGISGRRLNVTGRAKPDASRAHVRLVGTVSY